MDDVRTLRGHANQAILIGIAAVIGVLSLFPLPETGTVGGVDLFIFGHGLAYFALAAALLLHFHDTLRGHVDAVLVAVAFGVVIEAMQYGVPTRTVSFTDVLVNTVGASLILLDHHFPLITHVIRIEEAVLERIIR